MDAMTRRSFARSAAAGSLGVGLSQSAPLPTRRLGKIPFQASILGLGAQHLGNEDVPQATVDQVVREGIDQGINYIDTAPTYRLSEEKVGIALKGRRDRVFLVSKVQTLTKGDVLYQIRDSLRKLQTDHLDCVHIHNLSRDDRYPTLELALSDSGTLGGLREAKKQGMIKHIGLTSHLRPARVLPALETGEFELLMCTLNFVERYIYGFEEKVLPEARKRQIGVIAMKVLGGPAPGGARLASPADYETTLRYVWGLAGVSVAIIGFRTPAEMRQGLAAARAFRPLEPQQLSDAAARGKQMAAAWGPLRGPAV